MKLRIKNTKTTLLILSLYQILGGIIGLIVIAWTLLKITSISGALLVIFLVAIGLYFFSIKSGRLLLEKKIKLGLVYSMINQIFQVVGIGVGSFAYKFSSGGQLFLGVDFTNGVNYKADFGLTSEFIFSIYLADKEYFLFINVLAIFLLYIFLDIYREVNNDNNKSELESDTKY